MKKVIIGVAVFGILAAVGSAFDGQSTRNISPAARDSVARLNALRSRARDTRVAVKVAIESRLRDAESARYGKVWAAGDSQRVACGYVNAKNAFGGYVGEELFFGNGQMVFLESDFESMSSAERKTARAILAVCDTTYSFSGR